ncbi:hypothetical protein [Ammoniphilus sp. 3BR4]|uniref:hypothetical protein n=1 Tax=Ammoniphilus sp. 3BR4 TaxID=3158265 RepID=UPI0034670C6B
MKKIILYFALLSVFMMMLVGCSEQETLKRVDVQEINSDGKYGENFATITDKESIDLLRTTFEKVKWESNTKVEMSRKEDVLATLFFEFDKNMPEYRIWFNSDGTATIISNNEKEGYGKLDKENGEILKSTLLKQFKEKNDTPSSSSKNPVAQYLEQKGYKVLSIEGSVETYELSKEKITTSPYAIAWGLQTVEPSEYFGKTVDIQKFVVENHPLDNWESNNVKSKGKTEVYVYVVDGKAIGGTSLPVTDDVSVRGGYWSLDGKTLEEVQGKDLTTWQQEWDKKYK